MWSLGTARSDQSPSIPVLKDSKSHNERNHFNLEALDMLKQQPVSVKNLYCEICKLTLTSMIVATQHYDGRAHNIRKRELEISKAQGFGKRRFQMDSMEDSSKKGRSDSSIYPSPPLFSLQMNEPPPPTPQKKILDTGLIIGVSEYQCMTSDWISLDFESYLEHKDTVQHQIKEKMETGIYPK
uniref:U1-type domain-containing protein n=1 Tax=Timema tahoe TaxID=61484 RepID=A0A7R9ICR9_9NEOP|nr:unnamed protein product [Timema tahoe]